MFDNVFSIFVRGEGGFGGERGPEAVKADPPAGAAPDFEVVEPTSREQALLYRLSGDVNPLHADPNMAKFGGFDRPILHGLCTYGYAGRAILKGACGGDPTKLRSFGARFAGVGLPRRHADHARLEDRRRAVRRHRHHAGGQGRPLERASPKSPDRIVYVSYGWSCDGSSTPLSRWRGAPARASARCTAPASPSIPRPTTSPVTQADREANALIVAGLRGRVSRRRHL